MKMMNLMFLLAKMEEEIKPKIINILEVSLNKNYSKLKKISN